MIVIYEALQDINWHWCKCKKGNIVTLSSSHNSFFVENSNKLRIIGSFNSGVTRIPTIISKKVLGDHLKLLELHFAAKGRELRAMMQREGIKPLMLELIE